MRVPADSYFDLKLGVPEMEQEAEEGATCPSIERVEPKPQGSTTTAGSGYPQKRTLMHFFPAVLSDCASEGSAVVKVAYGFGTGGLRRAAESMEKERYQGSIDNRLRVDLFICAIPSFTCSKQI